MAKKNSRSFEPLSSAESYQQQAFDSLELDAGLRASLEKPVRELKVAVPVLEDNGDITVYDGFRVQHDNARGPFKGGLRFHPDMDMGHARDLAETMTWKTALMDLPLGGGKGGVNCNPKDLSEKQMRELVSAFTSRLGDLIGPDIDIPAPDVGTGPREMAWIFSSYSEKHGYSPGVVTGKPLALGGSQGRVAATGRGVSLITQWAAEEMGIDIKDATVAIQGFGNVGRFAAQILSEAGARIVAVSDSSGAIYDKDGLELEKIIRQKHENKRRKSIADMTLSGKSLSGEELLSLDVDVLIPAALGGSINAENAKSVQAKLIVEGANLPITPEANEMLGKRGIEIMPDILANAGGVVVSHLEWVQNREGYTWELVRVEDAMEERMQRAFRDVVDYAKENNLSYRHSAYCIAVKRVAQAHELLGV